MTLVKLQEIHARDMRNRPRANWNALVAATPNGVDLAVREHRVSLRLWLNRLKCHIPSRVSDGEVVLDCLLDWWKQWLPDLKGFADFDLLTMPESQISVAVKMFEDLQNRRVRTKPFRTFGPVATAKTLMAINPDVFPAWDNTIAKKIYGGKTAEQYREHLGETQRFAQRIFTNKKELDILEPSTRIGVGKLIDEVLYWVVSVN